MIYYIKSHIRKLEEIIFYVFLALLPLQVRLILWQQDTVFNEWRSVALYGTDLIFVALMLFLIQPLRGYKFDLAHFMLLGFLAISGLSIFQHEVGLVGLYQFLRLGQAVILFFYIRLYARGRFSAVYSALALVGGGVFQSVIGIGQFFLQADLGLRLLGESVLSPEMRGVAVFYDLAGEKVMRAYGTLPHPNLLAAYLLVSIFALCYLYLRGYRGEGLGLRIPNYALYAIPYTIILFAFLLTFSRTAIFIWLASCAAITYWVYKNKIHWPAWRNVLVVTAGLCMLFGVIFWQESLARIFISGQDEAVRYRIFFNQKALASGEGGFNINWLGVGIGNFVNWFMASQPGLPPYLYQPAHNIYLLIYSELGVFGLLSFLVFLGALLSRGFRDANYILYAVPYTLALCFLFIGLFDHFPWTLQQGRLMFFGVLALLPL